MIVRRITSPAIQQLTDLLGKHIGTDRGFSYPECVAIFLQHLLIRDDATSLEINLNRLEKQRIDAVLTVDLAFQYHQQRHGNSNLTADPLWKAPDTLYCALNPHRLALAKQIQLTLQQMVEDDTIDRILAQYQP